MKYLLILTLLGSISLTACFSQKYQNPSGPLQEEGDKVEIQLDTEVNLPENAPSE